MPRHHKHRFTALAAVVVAVAAACVVTLWYSMRHIQEALPLASLHKERDFAALLLDIARLEDALTHIALAPTDENLEQSRFALDLTYLRARDNRRLYRVEDAELQRFHAQLQQELARLEALMAAEETVEPAAKASLRTRIANEKTTWSDVRQSAQHINDAVFQSSIQRATAQRAHLEALRRLLFTGIALFAVGALALVVSLLRQRTAFEQLQQRDREIENLAFFDPLTNLANRRLLTDRLGQALASSVRSQQYGAIVFLDLDHFKALNDTQGHDVGDQLLLQVAHRLIEHTRAEDTVARLGGDEFVVLLENLGHDANSAAAQIEVVAEKIRHTLNAPYHLDGCTTAYHNSPSQGIALFLGQAESVEILLKQADLALYQAKDAGRNAIRFFNPAMQAAVEQRTEMESALRRALAESELQLYYQPQVNADGQWVGAEALIRWQPPGKALVLPGEFIGIAEDSGLIMPIGHWVLETACAQLKRWQTQPHLRHLSLAVNVSARQFHQPDFHHQVSAILENTGAPAAQLKLELTESVVLDNVSDTTQKMHALQALGVGFSMDDFGTGYSSLSYLKQLPLTQLKIDRSFVTDIGTDESDEAICAAIVSLAHNLDLKVVAEGVETETQRQFLALQHQCDLMQGYLFGKPLPLAEFEARAAAA